MSDRQNAVLYVSFEISQNRNLHVCEIPGITQRTCVPNDSQSSRSNVRAVCGNSARTDLWGAAINGRPCRNSLKFRRDPPACARETCPRCSEVRRRRRSRSRRPNLNRWQRLHFIPRFEASETNR